MDEHPAILLIEDEPRLRQNLHTILQGEGYRVVLAANGTEGIQRLHEESFDLVLTDLVMPDIDGFQVMEYLQAHHPDTVTVAITAYASTESAVQALRRGAYDYLAKPFEVDLLLIVIKRALEKGRFQTTLRRYMTELEQRVEARTHELVEAKERVEQSLAQLKASQEQLIQTATFRAVGEAAAAVANDLADPLTIIVSLAHSLAEKAPAEGAMKAHLQKIIEAAFCCQQLVQSVLTFTEAKASIQAMTSQISLSNILLGGHLARCPYNPDPP